MKNKNRYLIDYETRENYLASINRIDKSENEFYYTENAIN